MRNLARTTALLTIGLGTGLVACDPGADLEGSQSALTNATVVKDADLFWKSTVETNGCTGSIISPRHILTAGHCAPRAGNYIKFYDKNGQPTTVTRTVVKAYQEAVYLTDGIDGPPVDNQGYIDDWAVAYLDSDIPAGYAPAQLATSLLPLNSTVFEVGVSGDNANIHFGDSMRYVATTTQLGNPCQSTDVQLTRYCKGTIQAGTYSVGGDSGGPLFTYTNNATKQGPLIVHGDLLGGGTYTSTSVYFDKIMASTGLRPLPGKKYSGTNLGAAVATATARDCLVKCRLNTSCNGFRFDSQSATQCQLFSAVSGSPTDNSRYTSGVKIATGDCAGTDTLCPVAWCQAGNNMACGGTCPKCSNGLACTVNSDCQSSSCASGVCSEVPIRTQAFKRYANASAQHWVTTAPVTAGFNLEGRLGYVVQTPAAGRHALYGCVWGTDHYISLQANCEGATVLRLEGYAYDSSATGLVQLYRCMHPALGHFVSSSSNCENSQVEGSLGYFPTASATTTFYGGDAGNTAAGDWDGGYWKGTCDTGEAAVGLSKSVDQTFAHAALCEPIGASVSGEQAGVVTFNVIGAERRGHRVPIWDSGFHQLECGINESVTGVSQTANANYPNFFHALRCSAGAGSASGCERRIIDRGDGYTGAWGDWDFSYFKADCPTNKVMVGAGVNSLGTVHSIYCCDRGSTTRYEAEASSGVVISPSSNYGRRADPDASQGYYEQPLNSTPNSTSLSWISVGSGVTATRTLEFGVRSTNGTDLKMGVWVNNTKLAQTIHTAATNWQIVSVSAVLDAVSTVVKLSNSEGTAPLQLDYMQITVP